MQISSLQFRNLRVLVVEKDGEWLAQAIDIDYFAGGWSKDETLERFCAGFCKTILAHFDAYGSLDNFRSLPPQSEILELIQGEKVNIDSTLELVDSRKLQIESDNALPFPYPGVDFYTPTHAAA